MPPSDYSGFADIYDLATDPCCDGFLLAVRRILKPAGRRLKVLDAGCGTGKISALLSAMGHSVTGIDSSEEMLGIARRGLLHAGQARFACADIRSFETREKFNLAVCVDSINHNLNGHDLKEAFSRVFAALEPGGAFLFDALTQAYVDYNVETTGQGGLTADGAYIWQDFSDGSIYTVRITRFRKARGANYKKSVLEVRQRVYPAKEIKGILKSAGFEKVRAYGHSAAGPPKKGDHRWYFLARKPA